MTEFEHPRLGSIRGTNQDGIHLFRGLKYATLENAFAEPIVSAVKSDSNNVTDATKYGPTAISPPIGCDMEFGFIQKSLPHDPFTTSATECLNLNVCVPDQREGSLPVFVWIHGGGFAIGANAWPQCDLTRIVKLSRDLNKPVIGVGINYRLGAYGFLDSANLREAGVKPNRGLRDQRAALMWVKENIAGFGGDPDRVTVAGESAGGVSSTFQLQSSTPLFRQLVAMGGTCLLMKPLPPQVADATYSGVLEKIKIDGKLSPSEQLKGLLDTSPETFLSSIGPEMPLMPVIDGDVINSVSTYAEWSSADVSGTTPGTRWCRRVMLGDCQFDGSILGPMLGHRKQGLVDAFQKSMTKFLSNEQSDLDLIYEGYNISTDVSDDEALTNILRFATDVAFYASALTMAQAWPRAAFVYHFNEPNPWDGPWKGEANHILDVAFLFQNYNEHLDSEQRKSARRFGSDFISFVNGGVPYPAHSGQDGGAQLYGPPKGAEGSFVLSQDPADYGRRSLVWKLAEKFGLDKLSFAWDMFMAGQ